MKLLLDTNIFLEVLLGRDRAEEAGSLLRNEDGHSLFISDFSLHSIGVFLFRTNQHAAYGQFVEDMTRVGIEATGLSLKEISTATQSAEAFGLDFDDAYQYATAEMMGLEIVSFDKDFDRTKRKRTTPAEVLAS